MVKKIIFNDLKQTTKYKTNVSRKIFSRVPTFSIQSVIKEFRIKFIDNTLKPYSDDSRLSHLLFMSQ